jgi:hypothetical protein
MEPIQIVLFVFATAVLIGWVVSRIIERERKENARFDRAVPPAPATQPTFTELVDRIHRQLVDRLRGGNRPPIELEVEKRNFQRVIEHLIDTANPVLTLIERELLVAEVLGRIPRFAPPAGTDDEGTASTSEGQPGSVSFLTPANPHWRQE